MFFHIRALAYLLLLCLLSEKWAYTADTNDQFRCTDETFVHSRWFCDNVIDCADGSDESYGCDSERCGMGNFTCENSRCLPISVRCNKKDDCADGSDEKYCDHLANISNCELDKGKFLCADKLRCIDIMSVCNGLVNCFDASDENGFCSESGDAVCGENCSHPCFRTPSGPKCYCHIGDTPETNPSCKDITDCEDGSIYCDQKCFEYRGSMECACAEHYYYDSSEMDCLTNATNSSTLLYATNTAIKIVSTGSKISKTFNTLGFPNISAVAAAGDYIYWVVLHAPKIQYLYRAHLNGTDHRSLVSSGLRNVTDIAIDWMTGNIYYADIKFYFSYIGVCTSSGTMCAQLHDLDIGQPKTLAVAPKSGFIFWGTIGENPYVGRSYMDGRNFTKFVTDGVRSVGCVTVDEASEEVYWLDNKRRIIESIKFNGHKKIIALSDRRHDVAVISIFEKKIYWSAVENSSISVYERLTQPFIKDPDGRPILDIFVYNPLLQKTKMINPCSSKPCGIGICLLAPNLPYKNLTYSCKCSKNKEKDSNEFLCYRSNRGVYQVKNSSRKGIAQINQTSSGYLVFGFICLICVLGLSFFAYKKFNAQFPDLNTFCLK